MNAKTEILAPAGSFESLVAAVRSGADAVYLGMQEFSARRNAENFDSESIFDAVRYCHIRSVAVYLTLNIMLKNSELESALDTVRTAVAAGIDGIIVQDLGLAKILHTAFPELPLHASTQMSVNSPSALPLLKDMGFCRVVAAREMSKTQLIELCKKAQELQMEVEVFVHGALCMCVSGQCLMSAVLGGRSGNRGLCAGPCRLPFSVPDGSGYDLSLKDLSLLQYLNELADMGVTSFKIEGRMKRPEYVAAATAAARTALDGERNEELSETLRDVFSRSGFTDGYYTGKTGRDMFGIRTRDDVVAAGDAIPKLHEIYRNERQSVAVSLLTEINSGTPIKLTLSDGENTVTAEGDIPQKAANRPLDCETVKKSLSKLGSTPYFADEITVRIDDGLFVPASALNELRRCACEKLDAVRGAPHEIKEFPYISNTSKSEHAKTLSLVARFARAEMVPDDLTGISAVVLPVFEKIPEDMEVIVELPRRIRDEDKLTSRLLQLRDSGIKTALCGNLAAVYIAKKVGLSVIGDIGLNVCNSESIDLLAGFGLSAVMLSAETDMRDAVTMSSPINKGIFAYGRLPLMLTENCPLKNGRSCADCDKKGFITDRKGIDFPVRCTGGVSEILNSVPVVLSDRLDELLGLDFLYLRFDDENPDEARRVIDAYINGDMLSGDYTRGMYYKNII